jgi:hypothetical protein
MQLQVLCTMLLHVLLPSCFAACNAYASKGLNAYVR